MDQQKVLYGLFAVVAGSAAYMYWRMRREGVSLLPKKTFGYLPFKTTPRSPRWKHLRHPRMIAS